MNISDIVHLWQNIVAMRIYRVKSNLIIITITETDKIKMHGIRNRWITLECNCTQYCFVFIHYFRLA